MKKEWIFEKKMMCEQLDIHMREVEYIDPYMSLFYIFLYRLCPYIYMYLINAVSVLDLNLKAKNDKASRNKTQQKIFVTLGKDKDILDIMPRAELIITPPKNGTLYTMKNKKQITRLEELRRTNHNSCSNTCKSGNIFTNP